MAAAAGRLQQRAGHARRPHSSARSPAAPRRVPRAQDKLETLRLVAAHNVSKDKALAAEISRPVAGGDVTFTLGIARRLDNGALLKTKVRRARWRCGRSVWRASVCGAAAACVCWWSGAAAREGGSARRLEESAGGVAVRACSCASGCRAAATIGAAGCCSRPRAAHVPRAACLPRAAPPQVDHNGILSALYEQRLATGEKFVLSTQLDTLNIGGKAPKVGFALDLA